LYISSIEATPIMNRKQRNPHLQILLYISPVQSRISRHTHQFRLRDDWHHIGPLFSPDQTTHCGDFDRQVDIGGFDQFLYGTVIAN